MQSQFAIQVLQAICFLQQFHCAMAPSKRFLGSLADGGNAGVSCTNGKLESLQIGELVRVFWPEDGHFYSGIVLAVNRRRWYVHVEYVDTDEYETDVFANRVHRTFTRPSRINATLSTRLTATGRCSGRGWHPAGNLYLYTPYPQAPLLPPPRLLGTDSEQLAQSTKRAQPPRPVETIDVEQRDQAYVATWGRVVESSWSYRELQGSSGPVFVRAYVRTIY